MNHRYILFFAALTSTAMFAQRAEQQRTAKLTFGEKPLVQPHPSMVESSAKVAGDTLFYEDFANGLSGNTALGAWSVSGADGALWLQDFDGPNGDFSNPATQILTSSSAGNGFMIFDSNLFNDGCTSSGPCVTLNGSLETPVMDLSATPNVHISFENSLRWCCAGDRAHYLDVSTDGGISWPTRVLVSEEVGVNQEINTNDNIGTFTRRINLASAIAANPANVKIRFNHDGDANGNMSHYFWQIDDVVIVESENNDVRMFTALHDNFTNNITDDLPYTVYPYSQVRELDMISRFRNEGINTATNVTLGVDVNGPGGSLFTMTDNIGSVLPGAGDSSIIAGFTPPTTMGDYTVDFSLMIDSVDTRPDDNVAQVGFAVDEFQYGLDEGVMDFEDDNAGDAYYLGNLFYIENDAMLYAIDVCFSDASDLGATVGGLLLDANLDPLETTATFDVVNNGQLTSDGNANWVSLVFSNPQQLIAGEEYVVALEHFGGGSNVEVSTSGRSVPQTSFIYDPVAAGGATWFFVTRTPMVRMNFDATIGINENESVNGVGLGQSFPNPTTGITTIPYDLKESANVSLEILDLSGKVVMTVNEGQRGAGTYQVLLDMADLSEGSYFYTLTANDVKVTKRLTLVK